MMILSRGRVFSLKRQSVIDEMSMHFRYVTFNAFVMAALEEAGCGKDTGLYYEPEGIYEGK